MKIVKQIYSHQSIEIIITPLYFVNASTRKMQLGTNVNPLLSFLDITR